MPKLRAFTMGGAAILFGMVLVVAGGTWLSSLNEKINDGEEAIAQQHACGSACRPVDPGISREEALANNEQVVSSWRMLRWIPGIILASGVALVITGTVDYARRFASMPLRDGLHTTQVWPPEPAPTASSTRLPSSLAVPMTCIVCRVAADTDDTFCQNCGTRFLAPCSACGRENKPKAAFCGGCRTRLHTPPAK